MNDQNATPRTITDHITNPANDRLTITVTDEPGAGGANHRYTIEGFDLRKNPSWDGDEIDETEWFDPCSQVILFQNGPIPERGVNGVTQEALLAIVIDRLRCFQAGPYACEDNQRALVHTELALLALKERTKARMARGVEGTHAK